MRCAKRSRDSVSQKLQLTTETYIMSVICMICYGCKLSHAAYANKNIEIRKEHKRSIVCEIVTEMYLALVTETHGDRYANSRSEKWLKPTAVNWQLLHN